MILKCTISLYYFLLIVIVYKYNYLVSCSISYQLILSKTQALLIYLKLSNSLLNWLVINCCIAISCLVRNVKYLNRTQSIIPRRTICRESIIIMFLLNICINYYHQNILCAVKGLGNHTRITF